MSKKKLFYFETLKPDRINFNTANNNIFLLVARRKFYNSQKVPKTRFVVILQPFTSPVI